MSRPARAGTASRPLTIRVTDAERERWERCAKFAGVPLSEWLRGAAKAQAERCERNFNFPRARKR